MALIERREDIPEGKPTDLGWMLSCSGVHPEAVKIVEGLQGEVERLAAQLAGAVQERDALLLFARNYAKWQTTADLNLLDAQVRGLLIALDEGQ